MFLLFATTVVLLSKAQNATLCLPTDQTVVVLCFFIAADCVGGCVEHDFQFLSVHPFNLATARAGVPSACRLMAE